MSMLLATLSELSVTRERLYALERVAEQKGLFTTEDVESVQFTVPEQEKLEAAQNKMLKEVLYPMQFSYRKAQPRKTASKDTNGATSSAAVAGQTDANDDIVRIVG